MGVPQALVGGPGCGDFLERLSQQRDLLGCEQGHDDPRDPVAALADRDQDLPVPQRRDRVLASLAEGGRILVVSLLPHIEMVHQQVMVHYSRSALRRPALILLAQVEQQHRGQRRQWSLAPQKNGHILDISLTGERDLVRPIDDQLDVQVMQPRREVPLVGQDSVPQVRVPYPVDEPRCHHPDERVAHRGGQRARVARK